MKAYSITYIYCDVMHKTTVDASNKDSARNKIGRMYKLTAKESKRLIKLVSVSVIGYF